MQIAVHAGAHATDEDRMIACLRRNTGRLARSGVGVPPPSSYRKLLRDILNTAQGGGLAPGTRDTVLDTIGETDGVQRLVLSNPGFFGTQKMAVSGAQLYPAAEVRLGLLHRIFAGDEIALFVGLRNPAMFLPALLAGTPFGTVDDLLRGSDPARMRWSQLIERLRDSFPDMPVTVWCNEDTPLIWGRVLRAMTGTHASMPIEDEFTLLSEIMKEPGFAQLQAYMAEHPDLSETQRQSVTAAFLDKYADEAAIEVELDLPGWTAEVIDRLTAIYDADLDTLRGINGVQVIAP